MTPCDERKERGKRKEGRKDGSRGMREGKGARSGGERREGNRTKKKMVAAAELNEKEAGRNIKLDLSILLCVYT